MRLWYRDSGGAGVPVVLMHAATGQQPRLGIPDSGVHRGRVPRDRVRPARVRAHGDRAGRRPAGHRGRRSSRADGPLKHRSLPPGRHRGRRLRVGRLRAVVSAAAAQPGDREQHRRRAGRGLPGARPADQAAGVQRAAGGCPRARAFVSCRRIRTARGDGWSSSARTAPKGRAPPAQTMRNRITFALLETISAPTLLLTGGADLYAPPPVMQLFVKRIKGLGISRRARSRPLDVLGAAGGLQPRGAGVHPQALER